MDVETYRAVVVAMIILENAVTALVSFGLVGSMVGLQPKDHLDRAIIADRTAIGIRATGFAATLFISTFVATFYRNHMTVLLTGWMLSSLFITGTAIWLARAVVRERLRGRRRVEPTVARLEVAVDRAEIVTDRLEETAAQRIAAAATIMERAAAVATELLDKAGEVAAKKVTDEERRTERE